MQCRPFKEAGLIQYQADDDDRDKGTGGIPYDVPDHRNIRKADHAEQQREHRATCRTPAYA